MVDKNAVFVKLGPRTIIVVFHRANDNVTTIALAYCFLTLKTINNSPQSVHSLHFTLPHKNVQ